MSGAQRYSRAISAEVGEIERRLRALEKNLERAGGAASANVKARAETLGDAVASTLFGWADRFRESATVLGDQSSVFGKDAAKLGRSTLNEVSARTEKNPLFALGIAIAVGVLIGMAARSRD
ncbi:MAG TPA: hypothetical protein VGG11_21050 [Xanthobacteraceae bacterium]|jgi:hypothetical protein